MIVQDALFEDVVCDNARLMDVIATLYEEELPQR